jgi:hypothetical protein
MSTFKLAKADVTPVRQRSQFTCMSASMCMALKAHGVQDCDEDTVNKVMGAKPMQGASWEQALACAQHYGMRATLTSPCTVKQLKAWTDAGTPVMIAWNPEGREWSHASVVFDVDDDYNVSVADPNIPDPDETVRVVSKDEFYHKWFEKWPNYLVRRPAMAIEREVTKDGRQVMAMQKAALLIPTVVHETARRTQKRPTSDWKPDKYHPPTGQWERKHRPEDDKPKSWWDKMKDKFHGSDKNAETQVEAGKKEQRSQKDRAMARKIKYGPDTHEEKSDSSSSMEKAMWEARKQQGQAGLPGAGMGAGYHKDKSKYDRKQEQQVDREACLTQPLMTRRDYGAVDTMDINDYVKALKTAKNLPPDVERYVEEGKAQGLPEDQAWAVAWSRWCKYKSPGDEHCSKGPEGYFKGKKATVEDTQKRGKFERGVTMTLDEVAKVVGPEFKEMNENPPDSVIKVREEMQSKTASLMTAEEMEEALKEGKFEEGKPADPTENMSPEDAKEWERQNELHKDEFKTAAEKATGKWGFTKAVEATCTAGINKLSKSATRIAKALYAKDEQSPAFLNKHSTRGGSRTAAMLLKAMEGIGPMAQINKTAGKSGQGLYGFSSKTAKLGLEACGALHHEAGEIACDMFARKGADHTKLAGYLATNAKRGKCAYSALLGECCPDPVVEAPVVAAKEPKAGKKASDFMASDESEVASILAGLTADESTHPNFLDEADIHPRC